jgi:hypothetical protein
VRKVIAGCCLVSVFVGCSSEGADETPAMPTGGSSSDTGGTPNTGGRSTGGVSTGGSKAAGGVSTGGTSAGSPGAGGAATGGRASGGAGGRGGSGTGATGGTPSAPAGPVDTCFGEACPLGECDNGGFFADEECSDVYSGPVDEDSTFCEGDGGYCLTTITNTLTRWAVTCSGTTPMFAFCAGTCMVAGDTASCP